MCRRGAKASISLPGVMVSGNDRSGWHPETAICCPVSSAGQDATSEGHDTSNVGQAHRVTTAADVELGTGGGQTGSNGGHELAPKWPQRADAELARVVDAWSRLSPESRHEVLEIVDRSE